MLCLRVYGNQPAAWGVGRKRRELTMGRFTNPRDLYFGEGSRHEVKNLKGKKAVIVSGGHSMRRGGFLQDVQKDLEDAGFEVKLFEGVES